jgi:Zn-dependent peptidase ImmA (M78 family)/transcriptional regulator with XRE-family HTH domain
MSEKLPINPDILKWAREKVGMQLTEVARKMRKGAETISRWERGEESPTYIQLEKLAYQLYKRPLAIFFFPEPPQEESPEQTFRTLPDYEVRKMSPRMRYLIRQAFVMQINLAELNDNVNMAKGNILHDLTFGPGAAVKSMAIQVREYLGIDLSTQFSWTSIDFALKSWRNILEEHGIYVFKESFQDDSISGFCLHDQKFPVIYINNNNAESRQIFSIFHELAHLLFGTSGVDMRDDYYIDHLVGDNKAIETLCNQFSGAFLVPDADFSRRISNVVINDRSIIDLAKKYSVSREVILRKCLDRKLVSQQEYTSSTEKWIEEAKVARKKKKGESIFKI